MWKIICITKCTRQIRKQIGIYLINYMPSFNQFMFNIQLFQNLISSINYLYFMDHAWLVWVLNNTQIIIIIIISCCVRPFCGKTNQDLNSNSYFNYIFIILLIFVNTNMSLYIYIYMNLNSCDNEKTWHKSPYNICVQ